MSASPSMSDVIGLARRQLQIIVALDCSGSMRGDRIASLNYAMRTTLPELRKVAEENPEIDVRLRVLRFGDEASWHIGDAVAVADARWEDLAAGGETNMGAAFREMADALSPEKMSGRQLPPVLVLASDGYPTDDFEAGLETLFASTQAQNAIRLAIAIGSEADIEVLERFIRHPAIKPLRANNASELVRHIKWAATAPVKTASSPTSGPDPLAPLAHRTVQEAALKTDVSDLVW
jgi:uncharacterized protein YegL